MSDYTVVFLVHVKKMPVSQQLQNVRQRVSFRC